MAGWGGARQTGIHREPARPRRTTESWTSGGSRRSTSPDSVGCVVEERLYREHRHYRRPQAQVARKAYFGAAKADFHWGAVERGRRHRMRHATRCKAPWRAITIGNGTTTIRPGSLSRRAVAAGLMRCVDLARSSHAVSGSPPSSRRPPHVPDPLRRCRHLLFAITAHASCQGPTHYVDLINRAHDSVTASRSPSRVAMHSGNAAGRSPARWRRLDHGGGRWRRLQVRLAFHLRQWPDDGLPRRRHLQRRQAGDSPTAN